MRYFRWGEPGAEKPGVMDGEARRDLSGLAGDLDPGALPVPEDLSALPLVPEGARTGPCVPPGRIFCFGLNYADHAAETGADVPEQPILFMKACDASGPDDDVPLPRGSDKLDWEVELGVVIGRRARNVAEADALGCVAGYCVANDYSERGWQKARGGQWVKGKSSDGFGPLGPWLVTPDEAGDPQALDLWLDVNGERRQTGTTATMVFGVAALIAHVSEFITLRPGDVFLTGTPPGVGLGMDPPQFLGRGDVVSLGISGLGAQRQRIV